MIQLLPAEVEILTQSLRLLRPQQAPPWGLDRDSSVCVLWLTVSCIPSFPKFGKESKYVALKGQVRHIHSGLQGIAWLILSNPVGHRAPLQQSVRGCQAAKQIHQSSSVLQGWGERKSRKKCLFQVFVSNSVPANCFQLNFILLTLLVISVLSL